jgi:Arc/MetJ family transcription regulator
MRTNSDIDDKLMAKAMRLSAKKTKRETVEALKLLVNRRQAKILDLFGKIEWVGDLEKMRLDN